MTPERIDHGPSAWTTKNVHTVKDLIKALEGAREEAWVCVENGIAEQVFVEMGAAEPFVVISRVNVGYHHDPYDKWDRWDKKGFGSSEERCLAGGYHDHHTIGQLYVLLGDPNELRRINEHRGTNWSQVKLDEIIQTAIKMREDGGQA